MLDNKALTLPINMKDPKVQEMNTDPNALIADEEMIWVKNGIVADADTINDNNKVLQTAINIWNDKLEDIILESLLDPNIKPMLLEIIRKLFLDDDLITMMGEILGKNKEFVETLVNNTDFLELLVNNEDFMGVILSGIAENMEKLLKDSYIELLQETDIGHVMIGAPNTVENWTNLTTKYVAQQNLLNNLERRVKDLEAQVTPPPIDLPNNTTDTNKPKQISLFDFINKGDQENGNR